VSLAPCNNPDSAAGCANSTGVGGTLEAVGTTSVFADDLSLVAAQLPTNQFGIVYMGSAAAAAPFGDGVRCAGGAIFRYGAGFSGPGGTYTLGRGVAGASCALFGVPGCIDAGETWHFQGWYRDPTGPCGSGWNVTNGLSITFTP
jgi:hypothetical protein